MTLTDTAATELRAALLKAAAALEVKSEPTVESVYGKPLSELTAPEGWEFTGEFRERRCGDWFLSSNQPISAAPRGVMRCECDEFYTGGPRLILRKIEPPKPRRVVFEFVRHGRVQKGEKYRAPGEGFRIYDWTHDFQTIDEYDIFRVVEGSL